MSFDPSSYQQMPINGTVSYTVPPGYQTNLYYIPVSNVRYHESSDRTTSVLTLLFGIQLPFQTTWRQLKDYVRTVAPSVERVQIFPSSTTGWISVVGRDGFDAAIGMPVTF